MSEEPSEKRAIPSEHVGVSLGHLKFESPEEEKSFNLAMKIRDRSSGFIVRTHLGNITLYRRAFTGIFICY